MEDRADHSHTNAINVKSPHSLSVYTDTCTHHTHHSITSPTSSTCSTCIHHHQNFKSSSSDMHTYTSTTSHFSQPASISLKSNSPAIMIPNTRRNSRLLSPTDDNLTILHLHNSETIDTQDVYVMANETKKTKHKNANKPRNTIQTHLSQQQNSPYTLTKNKSLNLTVPKMTVSDMEESADEYEYDSEAHTITDEDVIIKRVLHKFNQQNQQIIRKKLSFVDSFQFFQSNIDISKSKSNNALHDTKPKKRAKKYKKRKHKKDTKKRVKKSKKKKNKKSRKKRKKKHTKTVTTMDMPNIITREHSESDPCRTYLGQYKHRKLSKGHKEILQDINRRAKVKDVPMSVPTDTKDYSLSFSNYNKHKHTRTITPFDPANMSDIVDTDSDYGEEERNYAHNKTRNKNQSKHKKTLTAMNINIQTDTSTKLIHQNSKSKSHYSPSDTHSMNTPEPMIMRLGSDSYGTVKDMHRKTVSCGPNLMWTTEGNATESRRTSSIVPNMEDAVLCLMEMDDAFISGVFEDREVPKPKLVHSTSSPAKVSPVLVSTDSAEETTKIEQKEWNELGALNEASEDIELMDDDMDDMGSIVCAQDYDDMKGLEFEGKAVKVINTEVKQRSAPVKSEHRRMDSAPFASKGNAKKGQRPDLHIYQTWNYFEEMSDSLRSDYESDNTDQDSISGESLSGNGEVTEVKRQKSNRDNAASVMYGNERVFSTFTKELALTTDNPMYIFQSLQQICVSLRSKQNSFIQIKHKIPMDAPLLRYECVISFLKLLGYTHASELNAYIITDIDTDSIDQALSACQQQLIEISKKSQIYQVIVHSRLRNGSIPPPPPIDENKSDKPEMDTKIEQLSDIDADRCQLYELIWSATHPNNTDHKAKDVILLCFVLITTPLKFMKLLEARFFNDDHGRASRSYSTSTDSNFMYNGSPMNGSPTVNSHNSALLGSSLAQSPTFPSSIPSLASSITFDYERIQSSYGVQRKVIQMIRLWINKYWKQDWYDNYKLLSYIDRFVRKANKAYVSNDIDFDEMERNKGLELVATIHKTIQKQRAQITCEGTSTNVNPLSKHARFSTLNVQNGRPRSVSSDTQTVNKHKRVGRQRTTSFTTHKRFSLLTSPRASKKNFSLDTCVTREIPTELLKIRNEDICNQLAVYIFKKYGSINARECLYQYSPIHKNKENIWPNIQSYKDAFNSIVKWVQSTILLQHKVSKRARIIKKWIKITDLLFNIRCFQGFVAVQCALASQAIYTLKDAWNQTGVLKRKHHTKFKEIKVIMSASHNFENLRRLQREAHTPLIPYFGLFCKDLIYVFEGVSKRNSDGMINWTKLWRISELIKEHLNCQSIPYSRMIQTDISMQNWLETELKRAGTLKSEFLDKIAADVAQKDKNKKVGHKKSFTLLN